MNKQYSSTNTSLIESGTKVPVGYYVCTECGIKTITVTKKDTKLPVCSNCKSTYWTKI